MKKSHHSKRKFSLKIIISQDWTLVVVIIVLLTSHNIELTHYLTNQTLHSSSMIAKSWTILVWATSWACRDVLFSSRSSFPRSMSLQLDSWSSSSRTRLAVADTGVGTSRSLDTAWADATSISSSRTLALVISSSSYSSASYCEYNNKCHNQNF
jgi:hypothetical protein